MSLQPASGSRFNMNAMPARVRDLTGRQFGRLVVLAFSEMRQTRSGSRFSRWSCKCECGKHVTVFASALTQGRQVSCGCYMRECKALQKTTHGLSRSPEYKIWRALVSRCTRAADKNFHRYGGRGIEVKYSGFEHFYSDIGPRPTDAHSVDRIDFNGHYEPGNVRWATIVQQGNNTSRNRTLVVCGRALTVAEWARETGIPYGTIQGRLHRGWSSEDAVLTPNHKSRGTRCQPCLKPL